MTWLLVVLQSEFPFQFMVVMNSRSLLSVHAILYLGPVEAEEYDICKATSSSSSTDSPIIFLI